MDVADQMAAPGVRDVRAPGVQRLADRVPCVPDDHATAPGAAGGPDQAEGTFAPPMTADLDGILDWMRQAYAARPARRARRRAARRG